MCYVGSKGYVTQRNKGRGRVVLRVAGVEMKMERHLLGDHYHVDEMILYRIES